MEALELIVSDNLAKTKIPRGQQKLILVNVNKLFNFKFERLRDRRGSVEKQQQSE